MHEIKEMIQKIVDDGDRREMEELSDMLEELACIVKKYDEELFKKYKMELYKKAYGNHLTREMAEDIVSKMRPYGMKWRLEESREIQIDYGLDAIDDIDFFVVLNSAYNDYKNIFGDNLEMYVKFTKDFIEDEDAKEGKVFTYFTTIPR